jgi:signal transduction histidine kinase
MMRNTLAAFSQAAQECPAPLPAELLLDTVSRGIVFVNPLGIVTFLNDYAVGMLRMRKETIIGKRVDMLPLRTPAYKVLSEQCRGVPIELAVEGQIVAVLSTEVRSADGAVLGEMTEIWDVTDARRSKRQMEEFVALMIHDLRSPLTAMMAYVEGIEHGMYGEIGLKVHNVLGKITQSGVKLNSMIEEMLDFYRLELGLVNLNRQSCNLANMLAACYRDNVEAATEQEVKLVLAPMELLPDLTVDCKQLTRVFNNLIGNAIKYTPSEGKVTVSAEIAGEALHVIISDTGIGIPAEDLSRIFFKYYRSAGATGFKGTGLGLAISKAIVEAHGGSIGVESTVAVGSRFKVTIPLQGIADEPR